MITLTLFMSQAFATNKSFDPGFLYIGTVIIDVTLIKSIALVITLGGV